MMTKIFICLVTCVALSPFAVGQIPTEDDYYRLTKFEVPEGVVLEASAVQMMPDGRLAVASRRGEIWMIDQPLADQVTASQFKRFAHGLHEPLSLAEKDGWLYVTQRPDVSRLRDTDGDGVADEFEVVADGWEISGDYHEYAFGSKFDAAGDIWVVLCLTGSFNSDALYRGWCVRVKPDGSTVPTTSGIRSPGGIGANAAGDIFYTDNQGPWNGTCHLKQLIPGKFVGHPGGFKWYEQAKSYLGDAPREPESESRTLEQAALIPEFEVPVIMFPYDKMGKSASGVTCDTTGGKFGPFENQLFVSDQSASTVMRVYLEKVQGHYQGALFPFRKGFSSGNVATEITADGSMFVGGTNRGWGSVGPKPFALERLNWTGKVPFEMLAMRAIKDGFELEFTQPVAPDTASQTKAYELATYTYIYQSSYGSPEVDHTKPKILSATVSSDRRTVRLKVDGLQPGHVHELHVNGIQNEQGLGLLHPVAYYTLNYLAE
jgi:glucose/arabinose dehydrogenase